MGFIREWFRNKFVGQQNKEQECCNIDPLFSSSNIMVENEHDEYITTYNELVKKYGLDRRKISLYFKGIDPATKMYEENDNGSFYNSISVYVPRCSQMDSFRGSLAHELWHVKTNSDLINKIGLTEFVKLTRNMNKAESLAFKTMAEFFSWKKAMEENEQEQIGIRIASQMEKYHKYLEDKKKLESWIFYHEDLMNTRKLPDGIDDSVEEVLKWQEGIISGLKKTLSYGTDEYLLCDTLAAHCARCVHEKKTVDDINISYEKNEKQLREIATLIIFYGKTESLCNICFEELGEKILEILETLNDL